MPSNSDNLVIVGISGGVDSAVTATLLLEQGYRVQGLHMTNWDEADEYCSAAEDFQVARQVCADLNIPLHHVNFSAEYQQKVFADFLDEISRGYTPNPDVTCNRYIKFGDFLRYAARLGADKIATGHYARVRENSAGQFELWKGIDPGKDQSYFLHAIDRGVLGRVLFPLGDLTKADVRRIATDNGLPNHARRDSTGICFIGERPFRDFLKRYVSGAQGNMETPDGVVMGEHDGLMYYTLGQRQGLAIGGHKDFGPEPWYVAAKDMDRNVLVVVQNREHPLLWSERMQTGPMHWLVNPRNADQFSCTVKTRYRQPDVACEVTFNAEGRAEVTFAQPVWAVTPGQYAVFYAGEVCLGGARIAQAYSSGTNALPNNERVFQARSTTSK